MEVQVGHGLAGLHTAVGHHAEIGHAHTLGHLGDDLKDMGHDGGILGSDLTAGGDVCLGDHQKMNGGLRIDVMEGKADLVLIYLVGGDNARRNLTKQTIGHEKAPFVGND